MNGPALEAKFREPRAICLCEDDGIESVLLADTDNHSIKRIEFRGDMQVTTYAGTGRMGKGSGSGSGSGSDSQFDRPLLECAMQHPMCVIPDPITRGVYWISDIYNIFKSDGKNLSLFVDQQAGLNHVYGLAISSDGQQLYATGGFSNNIKRFYPRAINKPGEMIVTETERAVERPRHMAWCKLAVPDSVLYIASILGIRKYDVASKQMSTLTPRQLDTWGVDVTSKGIVMFTAVSEGCVYAIDPRTKVMEAVAGSPLLTAGRVVTPDKPAFPVVDPSLGDKFRSCYGIRLIESRGIALVAEFDAHRIKCITLPHRFH